MSPALIKDQKLCGLPVQHKGTYISLECKTCHTVRLVTCKPGYGGAMIPRTCDASTVGGQGNTCGQDPFIIMPNKTQYVDQQQLKLQVEINSHLESVQALHIVQLASDRFT